MARRRPPGRLPLKILALVIGAIFVLVGIVALVGDPDQATGLRRAAVFSTALQALRDAFGDPGGGVAMILVGIGLGGFLFWAADRHR